jgi:hypothetical protein
MGKLSEYVRKEHLKVLHEKRRIETHQKADAAISHLLAENKKVNFNSVSTESGLTKATLYNNPDIRKQIEQLRTQEFQLTLVVKHKMGDSSKDAIIASLKRKLSKLEEENRQLKEQIKRGYGKLYKEL